MFRFTLTSEIVGRHPLTLAVPDPPEALLLGMLWLLAGVAGYLSDLGVRFFLAMDSDNGFLDKMLAQSVYVLARATFKYIPAGWRFARGKCRNTVHPGCLCLAGKRIELPDPERLRAVSAGQEKL